jgi:hypothetical protein
MRRRKPLNFKAGNRRVVSGARVIRKLPDTPVVQIPVRSEKAQIRPFICTCDKRMETFRRFVESYRTIMSSVLQPIVYYSGDGEEYHRLIDSLNPIEKIQQKQENGIQYDAVWEFPRIVSEKYSSEYILFLEDDLLFSSAFPRAIKDIEHQMNRYSGVDVVTLYGSGDCYWPKEHNKDGNTIYRFSGHDYYGNLAIVLRPKLMKWWFKNRNKVWDNKYSGWDIKIGFIFEDNGFNWYCTDKHYVQHQIGESAISGEHKEQQSSNFIE